MDEDSRLTACPECGAPAEVVPEGEADSTDGPVELVRVWCVDRHWFLLAADSLPAAVEQPRPAQTRRT
jgi:hypothetical protein